MKKIKVGIIGCGNISGIYLTNLSKKFGNTELVACADIDMSRAEQKAAEYNIKAVSVDDLLRDPEIRIVVNLTIPKAHAQVSMAALRAGKSVHAEKPLAITREDGRNILKKTEENRLLVGCAPDTFMGAGIQTCRKLIDDGWIGTPVAATAFMMCHGHEGWHPDPEFYYQVGGGPMFDMGPYYLSALINLLGPVKSVMGSAGVSFPQRVIYSEKKRGKVIDVEVPTHMAGLMNFCSGVIGTVIMSFDVWSHHMPFIEIYGSEGSLSVPDPNTFGGPVFVRRRNMKEWSEIPLTHAYAENSRGVGIADMASAMTSGRKNRAGGELAYHVLDLMHAFHDSSASAKCINMESTCKRPDAMPVGLRDGEMD